MKKLFQKIVSTIHEFFNVMENRKSGYFSKVFFCPILYGCPNLYSFSKVM